jgi:hypothetical protein
MIAANPRIVSRNPAMIKTTFITTESQNAPGRCPALVSSIY